MLRVPIWLIGLAAGAIAALACAAWILRADLADANAQIAGYQEAARMLDEHLRFVEAERQKWAARARELDKVEGADETLNPYERAVLDCVRSGQCNP